MASKFSLIALELTPQRVVAGLLFVLLLAYCFPPFRDLDLPYFVRLAFWSGVMVAAIGATWGGRKLVSDRFDHMGLNTRDLAFALVIFALFSPGLWVMTALTFAACDHEPPGIWAIGSYGVLFSAGLVLISKGEPVRQPVQARIARPRLVRRLPEGFEGEILRLTVRDHNVDVVTTTGVYTIRSRFSDAIAEMEPVYGHCTHRSHWVTEAAVAGVEKSGSKLYLRLNNDDLVPVSRKYRPELEDAGLI